MHVKGLFCTFKGSVSDRALLRVTQTLLCALHRALLHVEVRGLFGTCKSSANNRALDTELSGMTPSSFASASKRALLHIEGCCKWQGSFAFKRGAVVHMTQSSFESEVKGVFCTLKGSANDRAPLHIEGCYKSQNFFALKKGAHDTELFCKCE